jgi:hypothetical protein
MSTYIFKILLKGIDSTDCDLGEALISIFCDEISIFLYEKLIWNVGSAHELGIVHHPCAADIARDSFQTFHGDLVGDISFIDYFLDGKRISLIFVVLERVLYLSEVGNDLGKT